MFQSKYRSSKNYFSQLLSRLSALNQCIDIFAIQSWSEIVVWQAANGINANSLKCLFQAFLVGSIFDKKIKALLIDCMQNTNMLDEELNDVEIQKFICFGIRKTDSSNLYDFWKDVVSMMYGYDVFPKISEDMLLSAAKPAFKLMDIVESKCPLAYLKIFSENPAKYYKDKELYAYVYAKLKIAIIRYPQLKCILESFEKDAVRASRLDSYLN